MESICTCVRADGRRGRECRCDYNRQQRVQQSTSALMRRWPVGYMLCVEHQSLMIGRHGHGGVPGPPPGLGLASG